MSKILTVLFLMATIANGTTKASIYGNKTMTYNGGVTNE